MKGFFKILDAIDKLMAEGGSVANASHLVSLMTYPAAAFYAFERLDPTWLLPLDSIGYFGDLDTADASENGKPIGATTLYLKRVAAESASDPHLAQSIQRIVSFIPTPRDVRAARDIIDIAVALPKEYRRGLVPVIQRSLNKLHAVESSNLSKLLIALAEEGESAATVRLFSSVFAVAPAKIRESPKPEDSFLPAKPVTLMDSWDYGQELNKCLPILTRALGIPILRCLVRILADHLRFGNRELTFQGPDDYSYIWRPAIEHHEQNITEDVRDYIVSAIRDCAVSIATAKPPAFAEIIDLLDEQQWFIFTRILLHLISVSPESPLYLIGHFAIQPNLFSEIAVRHEYSQLLRSRFRVLSAEQQSAVLGMIEHGPDVTTYRNANRLAYGQAPSEEDTARYIRQWKFDWLSFIERDLPANARAQYEGLMTESGQSDHPDFPYYMRHVHGASIFPSDVADPPDDLTIDQALDQAVAVLADPSDRNSDRERRLIQRLRDLASEDHRWVGKHLGQFRRLPAHWLASVIYSAVGAPIDVSPHDRLVLLQLASIASESLQGGSASAATTELKDSLVNTLDRLLRDGRKVVALEHLPVLRSIGQTLLAAIDLHESRPPTDDTEFDPLSIAINTTDGRLVDVCLNLAAAERTLEENPASEPEWLLRAITRMLRDMPNGETEISAILGSKFPLLVHLSPQWAAQNAAQVFPKDSERRQRWAAAWGSYVTYARTFANVFDILDTQYTHAARELSNTPPHAKSRIDFGRGIARHVSIFFWFGNIEIPNNALREFFAHANAQSISTFLWSLGKGMKEVPDFSHDLGNRLRDLADWLIYTWNPPRNEAMGGLRGFGSWFPQERLADPDWQLRILIGTATKAGRLDNLEPVLKALGEWAERYPSLVVNCLLALVEGSPNDSTRYHLSTGSESILDGALITADADTRAMISTIADYFGAQGNFKFRRFALSGSVQQ